MSNKKQVLTYLRAAKSSHVQWRSHVQGFALGIPVDPRHLPLIHTDSLFGRWYYTEGQTLSNMPSYQSINTLLEEVHNRYMTLYQFVKAEPEKAGLFSSQEKLDNKRKQQIQTLLEEVFHSSKQLIDQTNQLEREAMQISEEEFEKLI